jgi:3-dehydroquinate dehydratase-2
LSTHVSNAQSAAKDLGFELVAMQSNSSSELVDAIHAARGVHSAIVINPGAFTHYAWSIHDALSAFDGPVVELHLSNPQRRESWRHESVVAPVAVGTIAGFGAKGYSLAIQAVASHLS